MLGIVVHPGNLQDRDGAADLLRRTRPQFPIIERIFATLPVLSHVEIAKGIEIKILGAIG